MVNVKSDSKPCVVDRWDGAHRVEHHHQRLPECVERVLFGQRADTIYLVHRSWQLSLPGRRLQPLQPQEKTILCALYGKTIFVVITLIFRSWNIRRLNCTICGCL